MDSDSGIQRGSLSSSSGNMTNCVLGSVIGVQGGNVSAGPQEHGDSDHLVARQRAPAMTPRRSTQPRRGAARGACISVFCRDRLLAQAVLMELRVEAIVTAFHYVMIYPLVFMLVGRRNLRCCTRACPTLR
jgi:hypothetical protein